MKHLSILILATLVLAGFANASIIPGLNGSPVLNGDGTYTWNYSIGGDNTEELVAGNYAQCQGGVSCGTFFTIYDFNGYVAGSIASTDSNWIATAQLTGLTPSGQGGIVDNPAIWNLTFSWNGPTQVVGAEGGFSAGSLYGNSQVGQFTFQAIKIQNGLPDQGQGSIFVPMGIPEPTSMALIGGGLIGLAFLRRKLAKR